MECRASRPTGDVAPMQAGVASSLETLRHLHKMKWNFGATRIRRLDAARCCESATLVELLQLSAIVNEAKLHLRVAGSPAVRFRRVHDLQSEAFALAVGIDGHQAEVRALAPSLNENSCEQCAPNLSNQKRPARDEIAHAIDIDPFASDVRALGHERTVDQTRERVRVLQFRNTNCERGHASLL